MNTHEPKKYKPCVVTQTNKLANRETDWNLKGFSKEPLMTRTRAGGQGRPDFISRKKMFVNEVASSDSEDEDSVADAEDAEIEGLEEAEEGVDDEEDPDEEVLKPSCTRAIIDLEGMMETLNLHCRCPDYLG
jgi:hypothetical protein